MVRDANGVGVCRYSRALCKLASGFICKRLADGNRAGIPVVRKNILMNERHEEARRRMGCIMFTGG